MLGIVLTVLAVLVVICLAFCHSDQSKAQNLIRDLLFLDKTTNKKN